MSDDRPVEMVGEHALTVDEARAMLCTRDDCGDHLPKTKSAAWTKIAKATQAVTLKGAE